MYTGTVLLRALREHYRGLLLVAAAAAYSYGAAGATPFTWAANGVTAGAFAAMAVVLTRRVVKPPPVRTVRPRQAVPLLLVLFLVLAFELATYFLNDRAAFPTLSSLYDEASRTRLVEAVFFFAWVLLGWELFR